MKVTADKKNLTEIIDIADCAEWITTHDAGEPAERARHDYFTIVHYFVYLAMRSLEDKRFAKNLYRALADVQTRSSGRLYLYLHCLANFVQSGRWVMYNSGGGPSIVKRIWNAIKDLTGFDSWTSMKRVKKDFESFTGCEMKFTTDKKILKKVIDRTGRARRASLGTSVGKRERELIENDISTVMTYLNWLGVKALESEKHAKNMRGTFKELVDYAPTPGLDVQLTYLSNFVGHGYTLKYGSDNENVVKNLARDFDELINRLDIDEVRMLKKKILEHQLTVSEPVRARRQAEEKREKEDENVMYG